MARVMPGWAVISWALVLSFPFNATMAVATWEPGYTDASARTWAAFGYLALFSMFLSFVFQNRAMAMGGVARIGQLQLLAPFVTFLVSWALLGEAVTWLTIGFGCLVVAIVFLAQRARVAAG
jgi:drug/metabolite transporter (DMT)-like permease